MFRRKLQLQQLAPFGDVEHVIKVVQTHANVVFDERVDGDFVGFKIVKVETYRGLKGLFDGNNHLFVQLSVEVSGGLVVFDGRPRTLLHRFKRRHVFSSVWFGLFVDGDQGRRGAGLKEAVCHGQLGGLVVIAFGTKGEKRQALAVKLMAAFAKGHQRVRLYVDEIVAEDAVVDQ